VNESATSPAFVPSGFFALRTPLLPFDELLAWGDGLHAASAGDDPARREVAVAEDRVNLRQRLRRIYAAPEVREALFVASPDLEQRLELWLREPEGAPGQKIEGALVRYLARMAGRATPFGLFAGCSVGTLGAQTRLTLAVRGSYRRHTRLDMDYLVGLTGALARQPELRPRLAFQVNSSLYPIQGRLRYLEVRRNGAGWTHHHVALAATDYLAAVLARAEHGASVAALAAALLQTAPDATLADADQCINELIDSQVLLSDLAPAVTGPEPIETLIPRLRDRASPAADRLERARQEMEAIDASGLGVEPTRYRRIAEGLPGDVQLGRLFQVDMVKPVQSASLGPPVLAEILRGVELLRRLAPVPNHDRLAHFREAFLTRYGSREVPLVEALDSDIGISFGPSHGTVTHASALLDGLKFPETAAPTFPWGRREALLLRQFSTALLGGAGAVVLDPHDVEQLAEPAAWPLPDAFAVMAAVAAGSEAALARGDFRVLLQGVSGPSGVRLLGRFCHADPELRRQVERHLRAEEALQPGAVFAEIVHLPEGRLGNVLARPVLRAHEIPYLGGAGVPADQRIPITDLRLAVVAGQFVLRSERLGRRVIPRLSSAHNFHLSPGTYGFLGALQAQGSMDGLIWDWGPLGEAPFLPRVVAGRLVLSRARWRAEQDELQLLGRSRGAARFGGVQRWRAARRLPRWVALADGDHELPIDLDNVLAAEEFVELVKGRVQATLVELFPGPDELWVRGPEGRFVHELVVPFVRTAAGTAGLPVPVAERQPRCPARTVTRLFPPGSEWLSTKLYVSATGLDQVLQEVAGPVVEAALRTGAVDRWFFVRYGDPDWHLRLRWHGEPARLQAEVFPALQTAVAPLLENGRIWRMQLDTYEREVERYGGPEGVLLAEQLFHADSEAVLALAPLLVEDARGDVRWRLACVGMHRLLTDLGLDLDARRTLLRTARDAFAAEFHMDARLRHQLGVRFRSERTRLQALLEQTPDADHRLAPGLEVLRRRSERLAPLVVELRACAQSGRLSVPLPELALSYLHMVANRLLPSAQRAHELVLYDFLGRLYESQSARGQEAGNA
jgi:thiopeptide-type bacteriocin biosynthesis protein